MRKFKIEFAPIDTKDNDYCVVSCGRRPATEHNITVMVKAELEYLQKLLVLQNEIKSKYQSQLQDEENAETDYKLVDRVEKKVWKGIDRSKLQSLYYS